MVIPGGDAPAIATGGASPTAATAPANGSPSPSSPFVTAGPVVPVSTGRRSGSGDAKNFTTATRSSAASAATADDRISLDLRNRYDRVLRALEANVDVLITGASTFNAYTKEQFLAKIFGHYEEIYQIIMKIVSTQSRDPRGLLDTFSADNCDRIVRIVAILQNNRGICRIAGFGKDRVAAAGLQHRQCCSAAEIVRRILVGKQSSSAKGTTTAGPQQPTSDDAGSDTTTSKSTSKVAAVDRVLIDGYLEHGITTLKARVRAHGGAPRRSSRNSVSSLFEAGEQNGAAGNGEDGSAQARVRTSLDLDPTDLEHVTASLEKSVELISLMPDHHVVEAANGGKVTRDSESKASSRTVKSVAAIVVSNAEISTPIAITTTRTASDSTLQTGESGMSSTSRIIGHGSGEIKKTKQATSTAMASSEAPSTYSTGDIKTTEQRGSKVSGKDGGLSKSQERVAAEQERQGPRSVHVDEDVCPYRVLKLVNQVEALEGSSQQQSGGMAASSHYNGEISAEYFKAQEKKKDADGASRGGGASRTVDLEEDDTDSIEVAAKLIAQIRAKERGSRAPHPEDVAIAESIRKQIVDRESERRGPNEEDAALAKALAQEIRNQAHARRGPDFSDLRVVADILVQLKEREQAHRGPSDADIDLALKLREHRELQELEPLHRGPSQGDILLAERHALEVEQQQQKSPDGPRPHGSDVVRGSLEPSAPSSPQRQNAPSSSNQKSSSSPLKVEQLPDGHFLEGLPAENKAAQNERPIDALLDHDTRAPFVDTGEGVTGKTAHEILETPLQRSDRKSFDRGICNKQVATAKACADHITAVEAKERGSERGAVEVANDLVKQISEIGVYNIPHGEPEIDVAAMSDDSAVVADENAPTEELLTRPRTSETKSTPPLTQRPEGQSAESDVVAEEECHDLLRPSLTARSVKKPAEAEGASKETSSSQQGEDGATTDVFAEDPNRGKGGSSQDGPFANVIANPVRKSKVLLRRSSCVMDTDHTQRKAHRNHIEGSPEDGPQEDPYAPVEDPLVLASRKDDAVVATNVNAVLKNKNETNLAASSTAKVVKDPSAASNPAAASAPEQVVSEETASAPQQAECVPWVVLDEKQDNYQEDDARGPPGSGRSRASHGPTSEDIDFAKSLADHRESEVAEKERERGPSTQDIELARKCADDVRNSHLDQVEMKSPERALHQHDDAEMHALLPKDPKRAIDTNAEIANRPDPHGIELEALNTNVEVQVGNQSASSIKDLQERRDEPLPIEKFCYFNDMGTLSLDGSAEQLDLTREAYTLEERRQQAELAGDEKEAARLKRLECLVKSHVQARGEQGEQALYFSPMPVPVSSPYEEADFRAEDDINHDQEIQNNAENGTRGNRNSYTSPTNLLASSTMSSRVEDFLPPSTQDLKDLYINQEEEDHQRQLQQLLYSGAPVEAEATKAPVPLVDEKKPEEVFSPPPRDVSASRLRPGTLREASPVGSYNQMGDVFVRTAEGEAASSSESAGDSSQTETSQQDSECGKATQGDAEEAQGPTSRAPSSKVEQERNTAASGSAGAAREGNSNKASLVTRDVTTGAGGSRINMSTSTASRVEDSTTAPMSGAPPPGALASPATTTAQPISAGKHEVESNFAKPNVVSGNNAHDHDVEMNALFSPRGDTPMTRWRRSQVDAATQKMLEDHEATRGDFKGIGKEKLPKSANPKAVAHIVDYEKKVQRKVDAGTLRHYDEEKRYQTDGLEFYNRSPGGNGDDARKNNMGKEAPLAPSLKKKVAAKGKQAAKIDSAIDKWHEQFNKDGRKSSTSRAPTPGESLDAMQRQVLAANIRNGAAAEKEAELHQSEEVMLQKGDALLAKSKLLQNLHSRGVAKVNMRDMELHRLQEDDKPRGRGGSPKRKQAGKKGAPASASDRSRGGSNTSPSDTSRGRSDRTEVSSRRGVSPPKAGAGAKGQSSNKPTSGATKAPSSRNQNKASPGKKPSPASQPRSASAPRGKAPPRRPEGGAVPPPATLTRTSRRSSQQKALPPFVPGDWVRSGGSTSPVVLSGNDGYIFEASSRVDTGVNNNNSNNVVTGIDAAYSPPSRIDSENLGTSPFIPVTNGRPASGLANSSMKARAVSVSGAAGRRSRREASPLPPGALVPERPSTLMIGPGAGANTYATQQGRSSFQAQRRSSSPVPFFNTARASSVNIISRPSRHREERRSVTEAMTKAHLARHSARANEKLLLDSHPTPENLRRVRAAEAVRRVSLLQEAVNYSYQNELQQANKHAVAQKAGPNVFTKPNVAYDAVLAEPSVKNRQRQSSPSAPVGGNRPNSNTFSPTTRTSVASSPSARRSSILNRLHNGERTSIPGGAP
ncbi:unnamed protein product [Amoebophrya sp. A25]|nr:unnamed protein product [Amoebophrya sp. A25]|eukprot:GSA25T00004483001.1